MVTAKHDDDIGNPTSYLHDMMCRGKYFHFGNLDQRITQSSAAGRTLAYLIGHLSERYTRQELKENVNLTYLFTSNEVYDLLVFVRQSKILEPVYDPSNERYGIRMWETDFHPLFPAGESLKRYSAIRTYRVGKNYGGKDGITLFGTYFRLQNRELQVDSSPGILLRLFLEFPGVGFTTANLEEITGVPRKSQKLKKLEEFLLYSQHYEFVSIKQGNTYLYGIAHCLTSETLRRKKPSVYST